MKKNTENTRSKSGFDTVGFFRAVKRKIAKDTKGMSFEEFKAYLNARKLKATQE